MTDHPDLTALIEAARSKASADGCTNGYAEQRYRNCLAAGLAPTDYCEGCLLGALAVKAEAEQARLRTALEGLQAIVNQQAEDDGLWFKADSIVEAYFQQELRRLHAAIEAIGDDKC